MKKIGIIGHFGGNEVFLDGQTVKTKNLKLLLEDYSGFSTYCVDTYLVRKHKFLLLFKSLLCLFKCKNIVILLSENGMNFFLPFFYRLNKLFRRHIFHDIIGSEITVMVKKNQKLVKYLNGLQVNWFEYQSGKESLELSGVKNVKVLPNCKQLNAVKYEDIESYESHDGIYTFCTFSRVMKEKGITEAIEAISNFNKKHGTIKAKLDVYGPVDEDYQEEFERLINEHSECVKYEGTIDSGKSVQTLKKYFALLFPTHWPGEGFPGTVLDCYASAVPIIASDWNANKEIIKHMDTGIIYPCGEFEDLVHSIDWAINNSLLMNDMKIRCRKEYEKYSPECVSEMIRSEIEG